MPKEWLEIADLCSLTINEGKAIKVKNLLIALFLLENNKIFAIENSCPHIGVPLDNGIVENETITCLWHGWSFNLSDGQSINCPGNKVNIYPTKIQNNKIFIEV